jgi:hypothetical protein
MKNLKLIAIALTVLFGAKTFADNSVTMSDVELKATHLQVEKIKLLELIAENTARKVVLENEIDVIKEYSKRDITKFLTKYAGVTDTAFTAAVYTSAKLMHSKWINPLLEKAEGGLITRLMQRFPKMSKSAVYVIATAAAGVEIYYTIDRVKAYSELTLQTKEQIDSLLDQKFAELFAAKNVVAIATTQLLKVNAELNQMTQSAMRSATANVK